MSGQPSHKTWCAMGWTRGGGYCNCGFGEAPASDTAMEAERSANMGGQEFGDRAYEHATVDFGLTPHEMALSRHVMTNAHDREALGLDASVCARDFLNEIVAWLLWDGDGIFHCPEERKVAANLVREYEARSTP